MDQRLIAGLGNIYVCEALWRAAFRPTAPPARWRRRAARRPRWPAASPMPSATCSSDAIAAGGSSLRDHMRSRRRARRLPAPLCGLRPRRRALPARRLPRHHPAHRPFRPLDLLLSGLPALRRSRQTWRYRRTSCVETRGRGRAGHAQPAEGAERAERRRWSASCSQRSTPSRPTPASAAIGHHRLGKGLCRRRRYQGDGAARPSSRPSRATMAAAVDRVGARCASR